MYVICDDGAGPMAYRGPQWVNIRYDWSVPTLSMHVICNDAAGHMAYRDPQWVNIRFDWSVPTLSMYVICDDAAGHMAYRGGRPNVERGTITYVRACVQQSFTLSSQHQ